MFFVAKRQPERPVQGTAFRAVGVGQDGDQASRSGERIPYHAFAQGAVVMCERSHSWIVRALAAQLVSCLSFGVSGRWKIVLAVAAAIGVWIGYLALDGVLFSRRFPPPPASPVEGRITQIAGNSRGLNLVQIKTEGGDRYEVRLDPRSDYGFDLRRLHDYQEQGGLLLVEFEREDASARATAIRQR